MSTPCKQYSICEFNKIHQAGYDQKLSVLNFLEGIV